MSKSFSTAIDDWKKKVEAAFLDTFREAFVEIGTRIIEKTPIDEGQARGSWSSGINATTANPNSDRKEADAKAELRAVANRLTLGDIATFSSSVPHIFFLEYGRQSKQAPNGMMRLTAQQWQQIAGEAAAKAKAKHGLR